jgi:hypothetical protein
MISVFVGEYSGTTSIWWATEKFLLPPVFAKKNRVSLAWWEDGVGQL